MKVVCVDVTNKNLSDEALSQGYIIKNEFEDLHINHEYLVYGISLWGNVLFYLIVDNVEDLPLWYPADLFRVTDNSLPKGWFFKHYSFKESDLSSIWGYAELVLDELHHNELMDRGKKALGIFFKRKSEMDGQ